MGFNSYSTSCLRIVLHNCLFFFPWPRVKFKTTYCIQLLRLFGLCINFLGLHKNYRRLGGIKQQKFILSQSGGQKSAVRVLAGPLSGGWGEGPPCLILLLEALAIFGSLACRLIASVPVFTRPSALTLCSLRRTLVMGLRAHLGNPRWSHF